MSSPLSWFRKNQKLLLGVFGVMLIFVFTVMSGAVGVSELLGILPGGGGGAGSSPQREVAANWDGGTLYESDIQYLRANRLRLASFMRSALRTALERGGSPTVPGIPLGDSDQALVETRLLAQQARDMGLVVNDDTVLQYLLGFTGNVVDRDQLVVILRSSSGRPLTQDQLFEVLREELLAQKVRLMAQTGVYPRSPAAAWDFFTRLNRQVKAELMPIEVAKFIDQVPDPSDAELETFYSEHKDQYPVPYSPEPGFKRRRQMDFQFVRADFNTFLESELATVTDQEIEDHYQTHKDDYRDTLTPDASDLEINEVEVGPGAEGPSPLDDASSSSTLDLLGDEATAPAEEGSEDVTEPDSEPPEPVDGAVSSDDDLSLFSVRSEDETTEDDGSDDEVSDADGSGDASDPEGDTEATDDDDAPGVETAESSDNEIDSEDTSDESTDEPSDAEPPADDADDADPPVETPRNQADAEAQVTPEETVASESDEPQAEQPDDAEGDDSSTDSDAAGIVSSDLVLDPNNAAEQTDAADQTTDVAEPSPGSGSPATVDIAPGVGTADATDATLTTTGSDSRAPVYRPLEEVRDQIRKDIAIPRAQAKMDEALSASRAETERFYKSNLVWQLTPEGERDPTKKPAPPDFTSLTSKYGGLTINSTGMVDQISVQDHELGQLYEAGYSGMPISFANIAFGEEVDAYKARVFPQQGFGDVKFLFWKVDEKEAFVPELDSIRAEVVQAWKMHEDRAVKLAVEAGEQFAQQVRGSGKTLAEVAADRPGSEVTETEEVSWMTTGSLSVNTGGQVYMSPIALVEGAGHAFRETMFRLRPGQVGVAVNQPETLVYVIRLISESPNEDILRERFLTSNAPLLISRGQTNPVGYLARNESDRMLSKWYQGVLDEMSFEWARDPQGPTQSE